MAIKGNMTVDELILAGIGENYSAILRKPTVRRKAVAINHTAMAEAYAFIMQDVLRRKYEAKAIARYVKYNKAVGEADDTIIQKLKRGVKSIPALIKKLFVALWTYLKNAWNSLFKKSKGFHELQQEYANVYNAKQKDSNISFRELTIKHTEEFIKMYTKERDNNSAVRKINLMTERASAGYVALTMAADFIITNMASDKMDINKDRFKALNKSGIKKKTIDTELMYKAISVNGITPATMDNFITAVESSKDSILDLKNVINAIHKDSKTEYSTASVLKAIETIGDGSEFVKGLELTETYIGKVRDFTAKVSANDIEKYKDMDAKILSQLRSAVPSLTEQMKQLEEMCKLSMNIGIVAWGQMIKSIPRIMDQIAAKDADALDTVKKNLGDRYDANVLSSDDQKAKRKKMDADDKAKAKTKREAEREARKKAKEKK